MSRILNCKVNDECRPWRAPDLEASRSSKYDYKTINGESLSDREQQEKIRQQSYEKSYAKGYMEGLAQGQREIQKQVESLGSLLATLAMPLQGLDDKVVHELAQLSMAVVKQMVRRELKMSPDEVVAVVREAINMLPVTDAGITLELHPDDAKLIREYLMQPDSATNWHIIESPLLTRGGCRVMTNNSRIDATVENRLNTLIAEVMGGQRKVDFQDDD